MFECVCVCVCVCARARVCARACACVCQCMRRCFFMRMSVYVCNPPCPKRGEK